MLAFVLAGCLDTAGTSSDVPALREAEMAGGTIVIKPPRGYCVDPRSFRDRASGGFAIVGSCASLTGEATGVFVEPAIITISTTPAVEGEVSTDSRAFQTALGRGQILRAINREDGLSLLHVNGGARIPPSADPRHWRGLMALNGQVIGLALYAATDSSMTGDAGMRMMIALADAIRRDSPASVTVAQQDAKTTE